MAYISLRHVGKRYQMGEITITAVDDISFEIEKGQFAVIVGPSGAGKTTVLNILGGWTPVTAGLSGWTARRSAAMGPDSSPHTADMTSASCSSSTTWFRT